MTIFFLINMIEFIIYSCCNLYIYTTHVNPRENAVRLPLGTKRPNLRGSQS